jgi:signal transduction histidine kinase
VGTVFALMVLIFGFHFINPNKTYALNGNMPGSGIPSDPYVIENCGDFQELRNHLTSYFILQSSIDCTGTTAWNAGSGFAPIGNDSHPFSGTLDGRGYSINGIYINQSTNNLATDTRMGIFGKIDGGKILDTNFTDTTVYAINVLDNGMTGGLAGQINSTIIRDVHLNADIIVNSCNYTEKIGGLVGWATTNMGGTRNEITASTATGTITVNGNDSCGEFLHVIGGLIGETGFTYIADSLSTVKIEVNGSAEYSCDTNRCRTIGGLVGFKNGDAVNTEINNSYSLGHIIIQNDTSEHLSYRVGGLIGATDSNISTVHSFSASVINVPTTCDNLNCDNSVRRLGVFLGDSGGHGGNWEDYWFDQTRLGTPHCFGDDFNYDFICNPVNTDGSDPDHFIGTASVSPINSWDTNPTDGVWGITDGLWPWPVWRNPNPLTPTNTSTEIVSSSSIKVSWEDPNPSDTIYGFQVACKKASDTAWAVCANPDQNTHEATITGLTASTQYEFKIVSRAFSDYDSLPTDSIYASTATIGSTLIHNCQELENIGNDLTAFYELAKNIDCSATANPSWNGGEGFDPIGSIDVMNGFIIDGFNGVFKGNNYTVSNLHSDQSQIPYSVTGLFAAIGPNSIIQDFKLTNASVSSDFSAGILCAFAVGGDISNVQVSGDINGSMIGAGGFISQAIGNGATLKINKSSYTGNIHLTGNGSLVGGFMGSLNGNVQIQDAYSNADIEVDSASIGGGFFGAVGLYGSWSGQSYIKNTYAAGTLSVISDDASLNIAPPSSGFPDNTRMFGSYAGFVIENNGDPVYYADMLNNFAHTSINLTPMSGLGANDEQIISSGFIGVLYEGRDLSTNYFDGDQAGSTQCALSFSGTPTCNSVTGQPDYFKNNNTNHPLDQWDFNNIWNKTSEFPVFGKKVTSSVSEIPTDRLPSDGGTDNNGGGDLGGILNPKKSNKKTTSLAGQSLGGNLGSNADNEKGILGAVKRFIKNLPLAVIIGFPYAMFGLILLAALATLFMLSREMKKVHQIEALMKKQVLLAEERDAFWHLAANYLRAPVTLIVGGAEALHDSKDSSETRAINEIASSLQAKVANIMKKIEDSVSLQSISRIPHGLSRSKVNRRTYFIPLGIIILLVAMGNYAAHNYRNINTGVAGYLVQTLIFIVVAIIFYVALGYLTAGRKRRHLAEAMYQKQSEELNGARHELIEDTATTLSGDVKQLEKQLAYLPSEIKNGAEAAANTLQEGAERLSEIIHSFSLLITLQESDYKPNKTTVDLHNILGRARAKLLPELKAKKVQIAAPIASLPVSAESELAQQVIESIIANAVDYSPEGSTVRVESRKLHDAIQLRITDEGSGIDSKELPHLFKPFVRADKSSAMDMSHGGFGINLYLDKLIMEKLGGNITAQSVPGKGTSFTLTWPTGPSN